MNTPRVGSVAKACTEVSTPERTRKVPTSDSEKVRIASRMVQIFSVSRFSTTIERMDQRGAGQPRHQRGVLDRIPEPPAAPAEFVIGPPRAHRDAEGQEHQAASVHGRTQRAQAASTRPSISAATAKENATEKPT